MASTVFTIDWNQSTDQDQVNEAPQEVAAHEKMAWEVDFSSSSTSISKPKLPKFLQEREKQRAAERAKKESTPLRSASDSQDRKPIPRSGSPLKSKSTPLANTVNSKTSPRLYSSPSGRPQSRSSKHSPAIKQPLFSVSSPRRVQSSPVDSPPTIRSPGRVKSAGLNAGKTREPIPQASHYTTPRHESERRKWKDTVDNKYVSCMFVFPI